MSRGRPKIPPRRRVFLGCEGASEASYGALLQRLANETAGIHIHIDHRVPQPGAGDPLQLVRRALQLVEELERNRQAFALKAILLDQGDPTRCQEATALARPSGFGHIIWQEPDHEALILRHMPDCQKHRPPKGAAMAALRRVWPDYAKAMSVMVLAERVGLRELASAAAVESELRLFLEALGFNLGM